MPRQYGYPLALLVYDPLQVDPTPAGTPQNTCLDMGSAGGGATDRSQIHGLVYSGGHVEFNPFVLDGGVIAWEIQTQSTSSSYSYNYTYGVNTPPPGFPKGGGTDVKIVRKSFITCSNYSDEPPAGRRPASRGRTPPRDSKRIGTRADASGASTRPRIMPSCQQPRAARTK